MANKKIQATAKLFLDTKDAQNDAAKFVNNLKQKLLDIETAADKFTAFKDMVDYLSQVDKALGSLKSKNADVFIHMFDGLDENLRKQLEDVFGVTKEQLIILDQLKNKVATAKQSGTTTGSDLKPLEQEVRSLYEAAGMLDKLDLSGKGKIETRIKKLETALEEFAVVFSDVNNKIGKAFGFDGQGFENIGENIVNNIKDSKQEIETSFDDLKKLIKKKVSEVFDAQVDGADAKRLDSIKKSLYDALSLSPNDGAFYNIEDIFDELADSGDEDKAVKAITSIAERLKNAKQELNNVLHEDTQSSSGVSGTIGQTNIGDNFRKEADKTVDAIEYGKKKIIEAWKDYYNAAMDAEKQGVKIEGGMESTYGMDSTKASIEKMLDKWNVGGKAKFDILSLDEYIVDKDIGLDDIEKEIDKMFSQYNVKPDISIEELSSEIADVKNDMSKLGDVSQQSSSEISSGMEDAKRKTLAVGDAFEELVKYISQSGQSPKAFFQSLESGAQSLNDDIKNILISLSLLDSNGNANFSSLKSGYSNTGGMISDDYVLISRDESKLPFSLETKQKSLNAKSMGANIGAVLEVYEDKVNGVIYELQNKVEGKTILDFEKGIVNTEFLSATDEQIKKLISDLEILKSTGLYVDWNGSNILYDKQKGFSFIDFFANSVEPFTVGAENSVEDNVYKFFSKVTDLDAFALPPSFVQHVDDLMEEVTNEANALQKVNTQQDGIQQSSSATASTIKAEEAVHEQNTAAINEENKALQAQIELKKKAQSMTWKEFAIDDSLTDMKGVSGLQTLSDAEKFWKKANYDKKVDFFELSESETNDIINKNMDYSLRSQWYSGEDFSAKTEIENAILANDQLRNAAMNKLYQIYKQYIDAAMKFDEFLNSELTVYRGDDAPVIYGDEQQLSFSFRKSTANYFDSNVGRTKIIPKNTIGSVVTPTFESEAEVFVPSANLPYVSDVYQSFEEYYKSLADEKKKTLDAALVQLEAQRVQNLLGDDLTALMDKASTTHLFNSPLDDQNILKKFKDGITPNNIELSGNFNADEFAIAYNNLSDTQKKLVAYYTSLKSQLEYVGKLYSSSHSKLGQTDLINTVVNDKEGIKKHVAGLTGEAKFKLFGDATQDIGAEVEIHKKNTQAIQAEQQAQNALNDSKEAFAEVQYKLSSAVLAAEDGKDAELNSIWNSIADVYKTEQKQLSGEMGADILSDGYYQKPSTGELLSYDDIIEVVNNFEKTYGDKLDYVKDYLNKVFSGYIASMPEELELDMSEFSNDGPMDYDAVRDKLMGNVVDLMASGETKKRNELHNILYSVAGIDSDSKYHPYHIDNGEFAHQTTGEIINVTDFLETIGEYETKYGENLQYVKDYVNKVFEKYNSQIDSFLSGSSTSFGDDSFDLEDELILDDFDISEYEKDLKSKIGVLDFANQYDTESATTKKQIDDLAAFNQQYEVIKSKVETEPIDIMFSTYPLQEEKEAVFDVLEQFKLKQTEIANMSLVESEDDVKRLQELQAEAVGLQNKLQEAKIYGATAEDYRDTYDLASFEDGQLMKKLLHDGSAYSVFEDMKLQYTSQYLDIYDSASKAFSDMMSDDNDGAFEQFISEHAKALQSQTATTDAAEQQLAVEQQITSEKKQQAQLKDAEQQTGIASSNIEGEIDALNNLLLKINNVEQVVKDKTQAFIDEGTIVDQVVGQEVGSLNRLLSILEQITNHINNIIEGLQQINSTKLIDIDEDNVNDIPIDFTVCDTTSPSQTGYALNTTVLETNRILNEISGKITSNEPFADVADSLNTAIAELKNVASGIVEHQKAQQTDKSAASAKIANNYGQLSNITGNALSGMGDNIQIENMKALADNIVRVRGAVQDTDGVWKGFVVDINESNNAVINAIDEQSAFAKSLNETAEAAKKAGNGSKEAGPEDKFAQSLSSTKFVFNEYRKSIQDVDYLNDDVRQSFNDLATRLATISDVDGLKGWKDDFETLKDEISVVQEVFEKVELDKIQKIRGQLNSEFKNLDFMTTTSDPTDEQQEILDLRKKLLTQLEEYKIGVKNGKEVELDAINQTMAALRQKINTYRDANDLVGGGKQKFGATAVLNATAKYNSLSQQVSGGEFANSSVAQQALQQYEIAYNNLIAKRKELAQIEGSLTDTQKAEFKELQNECNNYAKVLSKIITDSQKLQSNSVAHSLLGEDFEDSADGRAVALRNFVENLDAAGVQIGEFKNNFNQLTYVVDNGDGTFTEMTATINAARTAIDATAGTTKKATGAFESFFNELKGKFKSIGAYLMASFSFQEVIQVVRKGINYIREIDSALTELKKVTDATDESYDKFLQNMSKTASVVGSTVSELTTMTAEWARLGYSMEDSAKLAESTAILLNVSEFQDATAASEALISTMQAFQYTADESQHVVDILNEIGNNYAVSSDGIAIALQDSASALMEAGNDLEQATALIAAANRVVQDPNSVGSALRTISLRLRGTSVEVLEEMGEETDGVVEGVSKLQSKIKALSGVNILTDAGEYKDTYTILKEIGQVWEDMSDIDQAALLELMAGIGFYQYVQKCA